MSMEYTSNLRHVQHTTEVGEQERYWALGYQDEAHRRQEQAGEPYGHRRDPNESESQELRFRARSSWAHAAGPLPPSLAEQNSWSNLSDDTGTMDSGVGRYQEFPSPNHEHAVDRQAPGESQQRSPWQSSSFAHFTTGNGDAAPSVVANNSHLRRHSEGSAMDPTSSFPRSGGEAADSWHADNGGLIGGSGRVPVYRDHRTGSRGQPQWSSEPKPEPPLNGHVPWEESARGHIRSGAENGGWGGHQSATQPPSWPLQSSGEHAPRQQHSMSTSTSVPALQGGGFGGAGPSGGGLASLGSSGTGDCYNSSPGAYMDVDDAGEPFRDDRLQRGLAARVPHHRHSSLPQMTSMLAPEGSAAPPSGWGRGGSDPGSSTTGWRPLVSGMADSMRSSYPSPWPISELEAAMGGQAAGARGGFAFDELHGEEGRHLGATAGGGRAVGAAGAAAAEEGSRRRSRVGNSPSTGSSTCMEEGCDERPKFAYKHETAPSYCVAHRRTGMVDTRHPRCKADQCTKQPSFGLEGDRKASYCAKHKKPGMNNVTSRRCREVGCIRNPNFGFPGDRRATCCKGHRELGMVDIVSRRCRDPSCTRRPLYNMSGLRPVFCREHKLPEMIDVISARCQEPGCARHPSFGYVSDMKARRCARHRLENMEGVKGRRAPVRGEVIVADDAAATTSRASPRGRPFSASSSPASFSSDLAGAPRRSSFGVSVI